jgi:hypothetical protein
MLRAIGPGLQPQERVIAFDHDRSVAFRLVRLPAQARPAVVRAPRRGSSDSVASANALAPIDPPAPPPPAAAEPRRAKADPGYDVSLTPNSNARAIYDEGPYR